MKKMKKLGVLLIIFLVIPFVLSDLSQSDLGKIENIVKQEVREENQKLRADLNKDITEVKTETLGILDTIQGYQTKDKLILVFTLASTIVVAETLISFLKFQIWKKKRRLKPKEKKDEKSVLKKETPTNRRVFKKLEQKKKKRKK